MREIEFGTDGWRAVIGDNFTFGNLRIATQAISDYINDAYAGKPKKVAVGYDTRFLSEEFARTCCEVLCANGIKTILADRPVPTPAVSFTIKKKTLTGGIMLTASHNPPRYNGLKYKADFAGSADPKIIDQIEERLYKNDIKRISLKEAKAKNLLEEENLIPPYLDFVGSYLDKKVFKKAKLNVLVDSMYGVGDEYLKKMLSYTRCKIVTIHANRDAYFGGINPEPIPKNLKELVKKTKEGKFDIGLATDGDVDRIGAASPDGKPISSHKIMALILLHFIEEKRWKGVVVKTVSGSTLIDKICKKYKLKMIETPVGFKYICDIMRNDDVLIGGEESGGIGFKNYIPERDGFLSGLLLLEMIAQRHRSILEILKSIEKEYGKFCYERIDTEFPEEKKKVLIERLKANPPKSILNKRVAEIKSYDGIKIICEDESWLLLRLSGTEPILRIYAEASSDKRAKDMIEFGKELVFNI